MNMMKQLPRPTETVLIQKAHLEAENLHEELLELLTSYYWSCELFKVDGKYILMSCRS